MNKRCILLSCLPFLMLMLAFGVVAQDEGGAQSVVLIGDVQTAVGCAGDDAVCDTAALTFEPANRLYRARLTVPAGTYSYRVAIDGDADNAIGVAAAPAGEPIRFTLDADRDVTFLYVPSTGWATDNASGFIANVPGSYQDRIGCPGAWQPTCLLSLLQDPDGDGLYTFTTTDLPAGAYESKVAFNESWSLNYGADGARDGANIPFSVPEDNTEVVFQFNPGNNIMTVIIGGEVPPPVGNLSDARAYWIDRETVAWRISRIPGAQYRLHYSAAPDIRLTSDATVEGGDFISLRADRAGLTDVQLARFPYLRDFTALKLDPADAALLPDILRGQIALSAVYNQTVLQDATGIQFAGVLDDLYYTDLPLGVTFADDQTPTIRVWAPTARSVTLLRYADSTTPNAERLPMDWDVNSGTWSIVGSPDWYGSYYLYEIEVYAPSINEVVLNRVTDPYAVSLSMNSARTHIVDLDDPALMPDGWLETAKPSLEAPEDIVLYELHVRDFSIYDETVAPELRGTFLAFTESDSNGMAHLRGMAEAGLTHLHLLPTFDIATIQEDPSLRVEVSREALAGFPPDSPFQQELLFAIRDRDAFNWGYDPLHYTAPEGSYATDADGAARVREFRAMVQALNESGLRVVMDVVYNHTNAAGQNDKSVLDRIVPGYYHRLSDTGRVTTSTCCPNTATENRMMERLMIDSLVTWATAYRVDGFRFDLMGHHMVENMQNVRAALDALTPESHGVDGASIYVYGEGWDFGEVANNARGVNATQLNLPGTGIGTFNDRLRDAMRGGNPFGGLQEQGFGTGLFTSPNAVEARDDATTRATLLTFQDQIRIGLAGNLRDYPIVSSTGDSTTGAGILYNGAPTGYTLDPQEHIIYVSAHDNETLFDVIQVKAPADATLAERGRMQNLSLSVVAFSQGVPFFHAGSDMLRSKSGDRDSFNSSDWFNLLDFTYESNGWGHGLPPADKNLGTWDIWRPLLGDPALRPTRTDILRTVEHFREALAIRRDIALFRLRTAEDVLQVVGFPDQGVDQTPGVIVMTLDDTTANVDPNYAYAVVVFNATREAQTITVEPAVGQALALHPIFAASSDPIVGESSFDSATGTFTIPALTTAVFVADDAG